MNDAFAAMLLGSALLIICAALLVGAGLVLYLRLERERAEAAAADAGPGEAPRKRRPPDRM